MIDPHTLSAPSLANLHVLLVEASQHVGGMWASGVQVFDTRYAGHRCPVLAEFVARLETHYRRAFGDGSREHAMATFGDATRHGERPRFEPHVAERILGEMLEDCREVRLVLGHRPASVRKDGNTIREVRFEDASERGEPVRVTGEIFVDATYEADLAVLAVGQSKLGLFAAALGIDVDRGRIVTDGAATSRPGVFAGGDGSNGGREVVNAVAEGRDAALAIDRYLSPGRT